MDCEIMFVLIVDLFATVTGTPTGLNAVRTGSNTVQLSWTAPANNTPPVVGYEVFFAVSGSNSTQSGGTTTNTTITVILPIPDVIYDFFVVAYSDVANALPSARSNNSTIDMSESVCSNVNIFGFFVANKLTAFILLEKCNDVAVNIMPVTASAIDSSLMSHMHRVQISLVYIHQCYTYLGICLLDGFLSTSFPDDSIVVSWAASAWVTLNYTLLCDDIPLFQVVSTPQPTDTSAMITGLPPGSKCNVIVTAYCGKCSSVSAVTSAILSVFTIIIPMFKYLNMCMAAIIP